MRDLDIVPDGIDWCQGNITTKYPNFRFKHYIPPYWLVDDKVPELSVGFDANYVKELLVRHSLNQDFRVLYGTWSGRPLQGPTPDFAQDIVLATLNKS
jgi:hypothetical protein